MGILDKLFGPAKKGTSGLFNEANHHWQVMKEALLRGHDAKAQSALLEVVRLCQMAIVADPQKEGNSYVLLTNALLQASQIFPTADEELLIRYAAACIQTWWILPHKGWPITTKNNYEIGERWYQEVLHRLELAGSTNPASTVAEYAELYGKLVAQPSGFESIKAALLKNSQEAEPHTPDVERLSATIKSAVVGLALATSPVEYGERAREVHALAKVQADALVEAINTLTEGSPLVLPSTDALAELVFAMSQAEVYAFKSDPFMFAGAPGNVQASWLNLVKAAVHDEARALGRALVVFRQVHGLEP
jgi:hypothetical protein